MTSTEIAAASKIMLGTTEVVAMYIGSTKIWPTGGSQQQHDYSQDYFTIESLEDNNSININRTGTSPGDKNMSYSLDDGETWTNITLTSSVTITTINTGDKILFKGINNSLSNSWDRYWKFVPSKRFKVYGNAMSLLFGDNFINNSEFASGSSHNLCGLFYGITTLISAEDLILPALTCRMSSYNGMFRECTNLTTAPQLPAIQSATDCYSSMFEKCINLEVAPEINFTTLSQQCCMRMFCMDRNSKITTPKMTKSPILRCTTGASDCYKEMFKGNGNLNEITCLLYTSGGTSSWIQNAGAATGTFYKHPSRTWSNNNDGVPTGWTVEDYVES